MASNVASNFDKADDFAILWDKNSFQRIYVISRIGW